jgi:SAM-dependent methyltransferase
MSFAPRLEAGRLALLGRYLDRFYLLAPVDDMIRRQDLLIRFFGLIAYEYESLIDVGRNEENIRMLVGMLSGAIGGLKGALVLDFGCGTGLSHGVFRSEGIRLVGYDPCPTMREIARARGMTVWSPRDLARQPRDSIQGSFASYLFHLVPHMGGLRLVWSRLRRGGVLTANFHKGQGRAAVEATVIELGGRVESVSEGPTCRHGQYVMYAKA